MAESNEPRLKTRRELLIERHNTHLDLVIAHRINLKVWEGCKPDEQVGARKIMLPGGDGKPAQTLVKITAKDAAEKDKQQLRDQIDLCEIIERMLESEGVKLESSVTANP